MSCHQPIYRLTHFFTRFLAVHPDSWVTKDFTYLLHDNLITLAPTSPWSEYFLFESSFPLVVIFPQSPVTRLCMTRVPCSSELLRDLRFVHQNIITAALLWSAPAPLQCGYHTNEVQSHNANTNQPQTKPALLYVTVNEKVKC